MIEKLNDLLSRSLYISFEAYKNSQEKKENCWDIETALKAWTANSNRNVHSVTGKIPNLAIHIKNPEEIKSVKEKIQDYYTKKNEKESRKLRN